MVIKHLGSDYLIRLDKGELLIQKLLEVVKQHTIHPAWVNGLGGALWTEVGFYNLNNKQYDFKKLDKNLEIANLTGNITWVNNQPTAHIHIVLADDNLQTYAGHLKELAVAGTCEIRLKTFDQPITRQHDNATGLDLLDFGV